MKHLLLLVLFLNASVAYSQTLPDVNAFSQQQIFENWVQIDASARLQIVKS